jgi:serine/threonine protein kinase
MKQQGIVHRDIKPENVIISSDLATVKIVDFGLATEIEESNYIYVKCGTPGYVAPEILQIKDV